MDDRVKKDFLESDDTKIVIDLVSAVRTTWHDAMTTCPAFVGLYEAGYEFMAELYPYPDYRLWTGRRWLHPNLNHSTLFPQDGDLWRGLQEDSGSKGASDLIVASGWGDL